MRCPAPRTAPRTSWSAEMHRPSPSPSPNSGSPEERACALLRQNGDSNRLGAMPTRRITLVAHTHWDREWYQPFEVFRAHLVEMLDEALDELERDKRLSFTLDGQVSLVDDYLELRPTAEPRIRALVQAGRLHVGPWYTQADTLLAEGE